MDGASGGRLWGERLFRAASAPATLVAASVLISASLLFLPEMIKWHFLLSGALFFFAASIVALAGDVIRRLAYSIFLVQMTTSLVLPMAFYVTVAFTIFFIPALIAYGGISRINAIPHHKSLALMLSGWLISLVYALVFTYSSHDYMWIYDIYLLLGFGIAYFVYILLKLEFLDVDRLMRYIAFSGLLFIGMILVKYVAKGYAPQILSSNGRFGMIVNVNSNLISLYIGMTLSCAFFQALFETRNTAKRLFFYAVTAFYMCVTVITGSRGGFLGLAAIAVYFLWHKRSIAWTFGVLAGVAVTLLTIGPRYLNRLLTPSVGDVISDLGRLELLKAAFRILRDNYFFFGIGMNNYSALKMDYGIPVWYPSPYPAETLSSHNIYTEMWVGWGLFGLLGWLIFNGCVIFALLRNKDAKYNGTAKGIAFAMLSFLLYGFVDSNIGNFSVMFTYFSLVGAGLFVEELSRKNTILKP